MTTTRFAAVTLILAVASCSRPAKKSSEAADSAAAKPPAAALTCGLITLDEVQKITGEPLKPGAPTPDFKGYSICQWDKPAGGGAITLVVNQDGNFFNYQNVPGAIVVTGVGEDAVWNPMTHQLGVKLSTGTLSVNFLAEPYNRDWAEQIAKTALGRLSASRP